VREGLVLAMIEQSVGPGTDKPLDREAAIERLAQNCGCEMAHSQHVAKLAGSIYAQLATHYQLDPADQVLLDTAARLQDVGYLINYDQHHKHSYHLILHSRLPGFQPSELEIIANVARYHRGADPKRKHANYKQLTTHDQERVRRMAAILRLSGGLDRSNTRQVHAVFVGFGKKKQMTLRLAADSFPEVDIWGARKRAELFEKTFDVELAIEWEPAVTSSLPPTNGSHAGAENPLSALVGDGED
jgi:exopolyphosphatase/guanosine-5'-triphosphate,3'-diphosphate pyrophosphatase